MAFPHLINSPFHTVEVRGAVVASHRIQQVIEDADTHTTAPFAHGCDHPPLIGLWVISLHAGNGIPTAPASNWGRSRQ